MSNESNILRVDMDGDDDLRLGGEGRFEVPDYSITDPADKAIADSILKMDPVTAVAGPFSGLEGKVTVDPKLTSLPNHLRDKVERQLAMVPPSKREESERQFVIAALKENSLAVRTQTGVAGTSLPFHKAQAEIANECRLLAKRYDDIHAQLFEVRGYESRRNDKGEAIPVPIFVRNGEKRTALEREQTEIVYRINLLQGFEGQRRMEAALKESVEIVKALNAQQEDEAEIQQRAVQINREQRIQERAEVRARHLRSNVA